MGYALTRKIGESVVINGTTTMTIKEIGAGRVKVVFDAPDDVTLERAESPRTLPIKRDAPLAHRMRPRAAG